MAAKHVTLDYHTLVYIWSAVKPFFANPKKALFLALAIHYNKKTFGKSETNPVQVQKQPTWVVIREMS